jgi:hypothetical protein
MIILLLPVILVSILFLFLTGSCIFYISLGIRLMIQGKAEANTQKLRSGRITIINAGLFFLIVSILGYWIINAMLSWEF